MKTKPTKRTQDATSRRLKRKGIRHFKRCNWMMQAKGWKDCGCKATWHARGIDSYYCTKHRSHVSGWQYDLVPSFHRIVSLLEKAFGSKASVVKIRLRACQDVPNFLKRFDAIQRRTGKSTLQL